MGALMIGGICVGSTDEAEIDSTGRRMPPKQTRLHASASDMAMDARPSRFDPAALMQRDSSDSGRNFANAWNAFKRRGVKRSHTYDEAPKLDTLREHHRKMGESHNSLGELLKGERLDAKAARGLAQDIAEGAGRIYESLGGSAGEDTTEAERDRVHEEARDGVPARSTSALPGRSNPDHRRDFNSIKQGGADSAFFDSGSLFQR